MDQQAQEKYSLKQMFKLTYKYGVYLIFILMIVFFALSNSKFLSGSNILIILQQAAPMGIAVIGMTFVLMIAGIDISAGQNMYLTAVVVGTVLESVQDMGIIGAVWGYFLIYGIAIVIGAFIGAVNGLMVAQFRIVPFITTLATMSIARGVGLIISNSKVIFLDNLGFGHINESIIGIPIVVIIMLVLIFIFDYLMRWTPFGRHMMAIGNDRVSAERIGIKVKRNTLLAYLICGTLCGIAGVLSAGQVGAIAVNFAYGNEFIVISAAVLGGTSLFGGKGSIFPGAIIGIVLVTTIVNGMAMLSADPYMYKIVRGAIIFLAVMVDSVNYKGELR